MMKGTRMIRSGCIVLLALSVGGSGLSRSALAQSSIVQQSITLGELFGAVRASARVAQFQQVRPVENEILSRQLDRLSRAALEPLNIDEVARAWTAADGSRNAPLSRIARYKPRSARSVLTTSEGIAIDSLLMVTLQFIPELLDARVSEDSADALLAPVRRFNSVRRTESLAQSLEKLARYERKYGPESARLNVAEIGLNYVAQNIPPFAPSADGWPSPLELIASYVPSYLTVSDGRAQAWTLLEGGVRVYLFGEQWGRPGVAGLLRPAHASLGVALVNEQGGALREPWRGNSRVGAFVAWGGAKLAFVGGEGPNVFITQQVQLLPWVF